METPIVDAVLSLKDQTPTDTMLAILHHISHQVAFQIPPSFMAF